MYDVCIVGSDAGGGMAAYVLTQAGAKVAIEFEWWRARMLGGRTIHWGRISLRFGPDDFRGKTIDGLGDDWPIGYEELAPYYDQVDRLIGLYVSNEGLRNHLDGIFLPPPRPRCSELLVKRAMVFLQLFGGAFLQAERGPLSGPAALTPWT